MSGATLGKTWQRIRAELYTPEEISAVEARAEMMSALIKARKARGLTQKKLSELTGVRQPVISRLERGDTAPQIDTLIRLAAAMGMKMQVVSSET